jgi:hypothetical protein
MARTIFVLLGELDCQTRLPALGRSERRWLANSPDVQYAVQGPARERDAYTWVLQ